MDGAAPKVVREIEARIAQSIARYGASGKVRIDGDEVLLETAHDSIATELGDLAASWSDLTTAEQQRRVTAIARTLIVARGGGGKNAPARRARPWLLAGAAVVAAAIGWVAWSHGLAERQSDAPLVPLPALADDEAGEIEKRSCEATSARAERGDELGLGDTRGWVVEIALLRKGDPNLIFDPGLLAFVQRAPGRLQGRFVWAGAPEISGLEGPATEVEVVEADASSANMRGARLVFKGRYVEPYFARDKRAAFERLAAAIAERLATSYAGLYARCAHLPRRYAGAWFRGPGVEGAATALVWFMQPPDGPRDERGFDALTKHTSALDQKTFERWTRPHGAEHDALEKTLTLRFPFDNPARARQSSIEIWRELGLRAR